MESFDRYSNSGYKSLRPGHQYEIGARECHGFISSIFSNASSSVTNYSLRYQGDFYVCFILVLKKFQKKKVKFQKIFK